MRIRRLLAGLGISTLATSGLLLTTTAPASAAVFTVNTPGDAAGTCPVTCTLRAAVTAANANPGNDIIQFAINGTIALNHVTGPLTVNDASGGSLTISGNGAANTIIDGNDGGGTTRAIDVTAASNALVLQNLTIENAVAPAAANGGAVNSPGSVTTSNASFTGNSAPGGSGGAIEADTVSIVGGTFSTNSALQVGGAVEANTNGTVSGATFSTNSSTNNSGGALYYDGALTVTGSTFGGATAGLGNTANVAGGAIATINSSATLSVTGTTFQDNTTSAGNGGGDIYDGSNSTVAVNNSSFLTNGSGLSPGGAIMMDGPNGIASQTLTVTGSTFDGNAGSNGGAVGFTVASATGSITATIVNSTFHDNTATAAGGAVELFNPNAGTANVTLTNDTLAQNTAPTGAGIDQAGGTLTLAASIVTASTGPNCSGTINDGGNNLIFGGGSGSTCPTGGTNVSGQDPLLGPLQLNAPGSTATMALGAGSPAIDRVTSGCPPPSVDQRGISRPQGPACDIGAFEVAQPTPVFTATPVFTGRITFTG